jgi:hypothetical protein
MLPQGQNNVNSIQCRLSAVYMRSVLENINDRTYPKLNSQLTFSFYSQYQIQNVFCRHKEIN